MSEEAAPSIFIILGVTGDLARKKLFPAIYSLSTKGKFRDRNIILGVARRRLSDDELHSLAQEILRSAGQSIEDKSFSAWCKSCLFYQSIGESTEDDFRQLASKIEDLEKLKSLPGNRLFYLAIPANAVQDAVSMLGSVGLNKSHGWTRIVVEKPFGHDLASAQELNRTLHKYFDESQIYIIDHYLGKETVQNLLVFRFANSFFEHLWNRENIASVEITVSEEIGIERRGAYYEEAGALRDMVQNHLMQLLSLIAIDEISRYASEIVRYEKLKVLRQISAIKPEDTVYGQYTPGVIGAQTVPGYREELEVSPDSETETFVALKLEIANWRWRGVPFLLRTGKRMPRKLTQIVINYQCAPVSVFAPSEAKCPVEPNVLTISIQPDEGFDLKFHVKSIGEPITLTRQKMHFRYEEAFGPLPDAYEELLLDVVRGNQTLFVSSEWVEESWRLYDTLLKHRPATHPYAAGTWGPPEADALTAKANTTWQNPEKT